MLIMPKWIPEEYLNVTAACEGVAGGLGVGAESLRRCECGSCARRTRSCGMRRFSPSGNSTLTELVVGFIDERRARGCAVESI